VLKGCPHTLTKTGGYQFDLKKVQRWRARSMPIRSAIPAGLASYSAARARKENALATLREIQVRVRQGELVEKDRIMDQFFRSCRGARDRLQNIPSRVCGPLAAECDQHKVFDLLTREIHDALEALFHEEGHKEEGYFPATSRP
jgi:hypothetical protein